MSHATATTDELRQAFERCRVLHFLGWAFARAMAVPAIATSLTCSAQLHRQRLALPAQPDLFHQEAPCHSSKP